ncbi:MAG: TIR domain-containing protein [Anaerolineae bacterium]|nr:TIR domain-containing protein [Anaerolineae bacterium]
MAHVFISYSRRDTTYARKLAESLRDHGFDIWFDEHIEYGANWELAIFRAIDACAVLVVLMSPDSAASEWVQREVAYAERRKRPIYPLLLQGEEFPRFVLTQYVDVTSHNLPKEDFYDNLAQYLPRRSGRGLALAMQDAEKLPPPLEDTRTRRLEMAMPRQSQRGHGTEVRVKISLPDSPGLRGELPDVTEFGDEIKKGDVRDTGFPLAFPTDASGKPLPIQLCVQIDSDHYVARYPANACGEGQAELAIPPDHDSRTVVFSLTPKDPSFAGRAAVTVRLLREGRVIAENVVSTRVVEQVQEVNYTLAAAPLAWAMADGGVMPVAGLPVTADKLSKPLSAPSPSPAIARRAPASSSGRRKAMMFPSVVATLFAALLGVSALLLGQSNMRQASPGDQVGAAMPSPTPLRGMATQVALPIIAATQQSTFSASDVSRASATPQATVTAESPILAQLVNPLSDAGEDSIQVYDTPGVSSTVQTMPRSSFGQLVVLSKTTIDNIVWLEVQLNDAPAIWIPAEEVQFLRGKSLADVPVWVS